MHEVKSKDLDGQLTSAFLEISCPGKFCHNKSMASLAVWHMVRSY